MDRLKSLPFAIAEAFNPRLDRIAAAFKGTDADEDTYGADEETVFVNEDTLGDVLTRDLVTGEVDVTELKRVVAEYHAMENALRTIKREDATAYATILAVLNGSRLIQLSAWNSNVETLPGLR